MAWSAHLLEEPCEVGLLEAPEARMLVGGGEVVPRAQHHPILMAALVHLVVHGDARRPTAPHRLDRHGRIIATEGERR